MAEANHGLKDNESIKSFSASNIAKNYRFREGIKRQAMTAYFAKHLDRGLADQNPRGDFSSYMWRIDRQLQNELNGQHSRWGVADTYDHTRRVPHPGRDIDFGRRRRNDSYRRTFPRNNRPNRRWVNCDVGGEIRNIEDNDDYSDEYWGNSDYRGDHSQIQVNLTENGNACASVGLEFLRH